MQTGLRNAWEKHTYVRLQTRSALEIGAVQNRNCQQILINLPIEL
jgi:hypothetical protein